MGTILPAKFVNEGQALQGFRDDPVILPQLLFPDFERPAQVALGLVEFFVLGRKNHRQMISVAATTPTQLKSKPTLRILKTGNATNQVFRA